MSVTEQDQEKVWFAREVFNLFVKAFTNLKLYPHTHKHCVSALEEFSKRLQAYTKLHDVLRISINQDTLTVDDQPVYESESATENLAFRLYVDGLREVSVTRGVSTEEANGLANVFYQAIVNPDADSTLLLWEADFRNIDHVAINSLTDAWESPDYFSSDQLDLLKQMNRDVDNIVDQLTQNSGRDTYSFELSDSATELDSIEDLEAEGTERDDEDIFDIHEQALAQFKNEALSWGPERLLRALIGQALDGLAMVPEVMGKENVGWLLQEAVQMSLRSHDLDLLSDLLSRYEGELALLEEEEDEALFKNVFKWLEREENIDRLVMMSQGGSLGGPKAYRKVLELMGPTGMIAGVSSFLASNSKELRETLTGYMVENVGKNPEALAALLRPKQPVDVVKTGLFIVNKGVKGKALEKLLGIARGHMDPEVKKYAEHLFRTKTGAGQVNVLIDALNAESRSDRVRALQTLVKGKYRQAVDKLKECINDGSFLTKDVHERQAYIEALRFLGGTTAVGFLQNQTKRSTMVFNRKAVKEVRELAKKALEDLRGGR